MPVTPAEEVEDMAGSTGVPRRACLSLASAAAGAALLGLTGRSGSAAASEASTDPGGAGLALAALTTQQSAGQRVIYSYSGLTVPSTVLQRIEAGQCGGVIFFGGNISSSSQIASVVEQLRQAAANSPISAPLLLMTDQEGGQIRRLPGAPARSEKQIGASSNPTGQASSAGTGAGQNLAGVGMNVNLAPVLDVYRAPGDFDDQWGRSYSTDPSVCGSCGRAFITAQQAVGVAAAAKHFPGLGSAGASQNTDEEPVTLSASLNTLRTVDEAPYPAAVAAGVKLVMCSWAVYPALDASRPAGLSATVVQQELRSRNGFAGVTITDAIGAGALSSYGSTGNRSVLAAQAGMDVVLCSAGDPAEGDDAVAALVGALGSGKLDQTAFNQAVQRVTTLRTGLS
jgi:beta-N-acetylhexosaminidase